MKLETFLTKRQNKRFFSNKSETFEKFCHFANNKTACQIFGSFLLHWYAKQVSKAALTVNS